MENVTYEQIKKEIEEQDESTKYFTKDFYNKYKITFCLNEYPYYTPFHTIYDYSESETGIKKWIEYNRKYLSEKYGCITDKVQK